MSAPPVTARVSDGQPKSAGWVESRPSNPKSTSTRPSKPRPTNTTPAKVGATDSPSSEVNPLKIKPKASKSKASNTPHGEPKALIRSDTAFLDIIHLLEKSGCPDLTSRLDLGTCSAYPVSNGGAGDVFSGKLDDGTKIAIKIIHACSSEGHPTGKYQKRAAKEIHAWAKCNHPNVTKLMGLVQFKDGLAMVSGWAKNGNLLSYLKQNPSINRCALSTSICEGLAYLHRNNIVHGDLKGANVLISNDGIPMLTDFGNANMAASTLVFTQTATAASFSFRWTAPEIFREGNKRSTAGDVYALGMTILETLTGNVPYPEVNDMTIFFTVIVKRKLPQRPENQIPSSSVYGNVLWALLLSCWSYKARLRPSVWDVKDIMKQITPEKLLPVEVDSDSEDEALGINIG